MLCWADGSCLDSASLNYAVAAACSYRFHLPSSICYHLDDDGDCEGLMCLLPLALTKLLEQEPDDDDAMVY